MNASQDNAPVAGAEVVLRIKLDGQFGPMDQTTTDAEGKFLFGDLMVGEHFHCLPGANRDGVHYPGPRVRLTAARPRVAAKLAVRDALTRPCPLVVRRHEIDVRPEPGSLTVTESLLIANPSSKCYVGEPVGEVEEPITLRLAIPSGFERATFHKEFFGREFSLADGKLVTRIPWQPGERKLKLTYVLPNSQKHALWERPLDLPCSHVRVRVRTANPDEVACNLERILVEPQGESTELTFESKGRTLAAGHVLRLELGRLPVPVMAYARWLALLVLTHLIGGATFIMIRRWFRERRQAPETHSPPRGGSTTSASSGHTHATRHKRKRKAASRRVA